MMHSTQQLRYKASNTMRCVVSSLCLLVCGLGSSLLAQNVGSYGQATKPPPPSPNVLEDLTITEAMQKEVLGKQLPIDGTFYTVEGQAVTIREMLEGKPTILVPVYFRCPRLCNEVVMNLIDTLRQLPYEAGTSTEGKQLKKYPSLVAGKDFNIILFSIDDREFPHMVRERRDIFYKDYDGRATDSPGVYFVTANPGQFSDTSIADATIREITDTLRYKFVKADKKGREIQHPAAVVVLTPTGVVSSYNTQLYITPSELREQLQTAGAGKLGSTSALSALACFLGVDDDPNSWYRPMMRAMGWFSGVVLLIAIGVVYWAYAKSKGESTLTLGDVPPSTKITNTPERDSQ
jgi:protein SCO1/2